MLVWCFEDEMQNVNRLNPLAGVCILIPEFRFILYTDVNNLFIYIHTHIYARKGARCTNSQYYLPLN